MRPVGTSEPIARVLGLDQRSISRVKNVSNSVSKQTKTEDPEMKRLVLSSLMVVALGAGSAFAAQNANKAKPAAKPAAAKKSANAGAAASSNSGGGMKSSGKKHRKARKHHKKA